MRNNADRPATQGSSPLFFRQVIRAALVLCIVSISMSCRSASRAETQGLSPWSPVVVNPIVVEPVAAGSNPSGSIFRQRDFMLCADNLGRPAQDEFATTCLPCHPDVVAGPVNAERHAQRLRAMWAHFPGASHIPWSRCVNFSYELAEYSLNGNIDLRVERAKFNLFSVDTIVSRFDALRVIDAAVDTILYTGDTLRATQMVTDVGVYLWDRALRLAAIPASRPLPGELSARDWRMFEHRLRVLPPPPRVVPTQANFGDIEGRWATAFFERAMALMPRNERIRSRNVRLLLGTYVSRDDWSGVDSVAGAILRNHPRDSVAPLAQALARFRRVQNAISEYPEVDRAFDRALRAMPRVDSVAYDDFRDVAASLDEFRDELLFEDRTRIDARSWAILDPVWLTPVNEVQVVRRARIAEADFRYAYLSGANQSGRETPLGIMLLKRGIPDAQWTRLPSPVLANMRFERRWPGNLKLEFEAMEATGSDLHRVVWYSDRLRLQERVLEPLERTPERMKRCSPVETISLFTCVKNQGTWFGDVPFYHPSDSVDVTAARFRVSRDSVEQYFGARMPLRRFWPRYHVSARPTDSILVGLTVRTAIGATLHRAVAARALPASNEVAWFDQWTVRVPTTGVMHRVELFNTRQQVHARGSRLLTSSDEAGFSTTGFGLSDVLVAQTIEPTRPILRTWRDLAITPNGGVTAPRQSVALAWEVYELQQAQDGTYSWRVSISREDGKPMVAEDIRSAVIGLPNTTVVSAEPDASQISYRRREPARPTVVEFLRFNMTDAQPGRHVLVVQVEDLVAKRITRRTAAVRVLPNSAQLRQ